MRRKATVLTAVLALLFSNGCMKLGVDMIGAPTMVEISRKMGRVKSYQLAREGIPGEILMATAVMELSPDNASLLKECAYIYFAYGLFVEDTDADYAKELFDIGRSYGMRALKQHSGFGKGLDKGIPVRELVHLLGPEYAPALCWTSLNAGLWVLLNLDDPMSLIETADIIAMAKQSITLDEDYFHGVAKAFLGCYYAMVPKAVNPECGPENASAMFQEARKVDKGAMLLIDLLEARFLSANVNDEARFDLLLNRVLETDSAVLENGYLLNEMAKEKARFSLNNRHLYF